ncbi:MULTISPECIES: nucleotide exchange factor GrpE [Rhodococcus]|uniref:Protein GrpE n=1 Tax=Rhodococcus oxybenzonivorans TaxID=1990687 RepID=A0AAE4V571_9NOCA|nr:MULTISPECIES: nucleotide exchange factor GrpE [Rhodococcus]MDV7243160.1 nucleotide exchange factor GrpE [Rhodococcus oxybenzonivorans]MDV7268354.1 nucleotide exchange factor GrpE [Rhodococcus oxybenzonivorans]MDV7278092.1 nucleotide exchange factor GrpE [Rhodococcus oxybenzonivorans]MDV7334581.1 nucleotide exchange factor GrpE [Rhodococcus oxybenzonivorans]MDV7344735.1 nucleotide exchange factor GrpE [Rhodococcus oxybenzonivorans]
MSTERTNGKQPPREPISITDKRRVDPETGQVREHTPSQPPVAGGRSQSAAGGRTGAPDEDRVAELTADLQRLQAEFANYRRRVERDRQVTAEITKASIAEKFLGILDDLDRARSHGDLEHGPLRAISSKIRATLADLGVAAFGEEGDPFDPTLHEAVQHEGDGHELVVGSVLRRGYKFGDRKVLRTAMVTVVDAHRS